MAARSKNHLKISMGSPLALLILTTLAQAREEVDWPQTPPPGAQALPNIEYAKPDNQPLLLDLYLPPRLDRPVPLVIWIHGGGWTKGDKAPPTAMPLVYRGYAVACINYRLAPQYTFPDPVYDCKAAVRFLRANAAKYHLDPDRFGLWGDSVGSYLAAMVATTAPAKKLEGNLGNPDVSSRVQAVCDWYGPMDLTQIDYPSSRNPVAVFLNATDDRKPKTAAQASPVTHVTKETPPFLILHGAKDSAVPLAQSQTMEAALKKSGVEASLIVYDDLGHWKNWVGDARVLKDVTAFFDKHLQPGK